MPVFYNFSTCVNSVNYVNALFRSGTDPISLLILLLFFFFLG